MGQMNEQQTNTPSTDEVNKQEIPPNDPWLSPDEAVVDLGPMPEQMSDEERKARIEAFAMRVAEKLGESDDMPLGQLRKLTELCGEDFINKVLRKTAEVEAKGGLLTHDGTRRRSVGGTFFFLAKRRMPYTAFTIIYPDQNYPGDPPKKKRTDDKPKKQGQKGKGKGGKGGKGAKGKGKPKGKGAPKGKAPRQQKSPRPQQRDNQPERKRTHRPPPAPRQQVNVPDLSPAAPPQVAAKLKQLMIAAETFRKKIASLEAKPPDQRFGLESTRKLLANTERQIEDLKKRYAK